MFLICLGRPHRTVDVYPFVHSTRHQPPRLLCGHMGEGEEQEKEEGRGKECGDIGQGEMWEGKGEWQRGVGKERERGGQEY